MPSTDLSSYSSRFQENLILWQLSGESDLFIHLNVLRGGLPQKNLENIGKEEKIYFNFYRNCFLLECIGLSLTVPVGLCGYLFFKEWKKSKPDSQILRKSLIRLFLVGVPVFNLFFFNTYRRYFHTLSIEKQLKLKYNDQLREMRQRRKKLGVN